MRFVMTDEEFTYNLEFAVDMVRHLTGTMPEAGFVPTSLFYCEPEEEDKPRYHIISPMIGFDMRRRHEILYALGQKFAKDEVVVLAFFFISEAWISTQPLDKPRKYALPEQDPERKEVITVAGITLDKRQGVAMVEVTRNAHNHLVAGESSCHVSKSGAKSQMVNIIGDYFFQGYVHEVTREKANVPGFVGPNGRKDRKKSAKARWN